MNALGTEIAAIIAHEGPISLERYMTLCLQHPRHGYYMTRDPFGASGDFVTAPEISQMFGEMLGVWIGEAWTAAGRPADARLVELGPGRGVLMSDVLRVGRVAPGFLDAISVDLVETSPVLRETQARTLEQAPAPVKWRAAFDEIPRAPLFILANEFFDALPARHFVRTEHGPPFRPWRPSDASIARLDNGLFPDAMGGWRERLVGLTAAGKLSLRHQQLRRPRLGRSRRRAVRARRRGLGRRDDSGAERGAHRRTARRDARRRHRALAVDPARRRRAAHGGGGRVVGTGRFRRPDRPALGAPLVGSDLLRASVPAGVTLGASLVIITDAASRALFAPLEIPLGVLLAFIGVPVFLYLYLRGTARTYASTRLPDSRA